MLTLDKIPEFLFIYNKDLSHRECINVEVFMTLKALSASSVFALSSLDGCVSTGLNASQSDRIEIAQIVGRVLRTTLDCSSRHCP